MTGPRTGASISSAMRLWPPQVAGTDSLLPGPNASTTLVNAPYSTP